MACMNTTTAIVTRAKKLEDSSPKEQYDRRRICGVDCLACNKEIYSQPLWSLVFTGKEGYDACHHESGKVLQELERTDGFDAFRSS